MPSVTEFLSDFISTYRKGYGTNHEVFRPIENWKAALDTNLFTGVILMDLSKALDCIPHNQLIIKLHAYGLSFEMVTLTSYLKNCSQCVEINIIYRNFLKILSDVSQCSIPGWL